ncbi:ER membrane protein complex subunit 10-like [Symsagittifera roscoffensis]|uniref:ER membrane protein complex subunit 10-like n=1 Tax=Symsagittifera roscoffensis TaxID=84072 RepID=UPI00307BBE51
MRKRFIFLCLIEVLAAFATEIQPDDGSCILEHFLGNWKPKAKLSFSIDKVTYEPFEINLQRTELLHHLANSNSLYQFRLNCVSSENKPYTVQSYTKGCALLHSGLREKLFVSLTPTRHVKGVHIKLETDGAFCDPQFLSTAPIPDEFSTVVDYIAHSPSPAPDTQSFLDKIKEEQREKLANPPDNRGFLQKYWMYILPAVLILFMNSQGGGGGGR